MKTKIQIKSIFGNVLFEFEKEDNSIKETLLKALSERADLYGADLRVADLRGANLQGADLYGADLYGADLRVADLSKENQKKIYQQNTILPEGELIVWKKLSGNCIAKLLVPAKAKRVHCIGSRKCRFEYVKTIMIYDLDNKVRIKEKEGTYNSTTIYKVGEITKPDKFNPSPLIECSNGIHAFITKQEAINY